EDILGDRAQHDSSLCISRGLHCKTAHLLKHPASQDPEPPPTFKGTIGDATVGHGHRDLPRMALIEEVRPKLRLHENNRLGPDGLQRAPDCEAPIEREITESGGVANPRP